MGSRKTWHFPNNAEKKTSVSAENRQRYVIFIFRQHYSVNIHASKTRKWNVPSLYSCTTIKLLDLSQFCARFYHVSIMLLALFLSCAENLKNVQTKGKQYIPNFIVLLLIPFFRSSCLSFARRLDLFLRRLRAGDTLYFLRAVFLRLLDIKNYSGWLNRENFTHQNRNVLSFYEAFSVQVLPTTVHNGYKQNSYEQYVRI